MPESRSAHVSKHLIGNLPYSANAESLKAHFEKIQPISVRVATQPDKPTKCRGFGFVEFDNYDRMKTCLKLYHHSSFDDGKYPPRRINVELT
jgi:nucleolar protein 6